MQDFKVLVDPNLMANAESPLVAISVIVAVIVIITVALAAVELRRKKRK